MFNKIQHVSPNNMTARVFLAFLATAGLFYVNIMPALGGFASKMGLATGPVVAAWLLGEDSYQSLIIVAAIILLTSAMLAWKPARLQDRALP